MSGRDDLDAVHLHDAGQRVDELLDDLAVTAILHEVGYALRRTGNLNGNALLVRDKADDDALTSGHEGQGCLEGEVACVHVRPHHGRLRHTRDGSHRRLEHLLVRQRVLERLLVFAYTHGGLLAYLIDVLPAA